MLDIADWAEAIRYRWKLVAVAMVAFLLVAVIYIALAPRLYTAEARLLVDSEAPDPIAVSDDGAKSSGPSRNVMATQADLVRSPMVASGAARLAGFDRSSTSRAKWQRATDGKQPFADWLSDYMLRHLAVTPGKDSDVLVITGSAGNAADAAKIANGFAQSSVESQMELRTQPAKAFSQWLTVQLSSAKGRVVRSQDALSAYVQKTGIANDGDLSAEGAQMADVATQLAAAEARAAAARQASGSSALARGDAEGSEAIQRIRQQVAEKSGRLADLQSTFGPDYPEVKRTQAELGALQSKLDGEVARASAAFGSARDAQTGADRAAANASESRLRAITSEQRGRLLRMGTGLAEYDRLKNEFAAAQRNYNDLDQRLSRMRLQGNLPLTDVQILDRASIPLLPSSPRTGLILFLSLLLGALAGIVAAVWLEYRFARIRGWRGIERRLGVKVLGRIALPQPGPHRIGGPPSRLQIEGGR